MGSARTSTIVTFCLLALIMAIALWLPDSLPATQAIQPDQSEALTLTGVVRDFLDTHVDFNTVASDGNGHYVGSVETLLNSSSVPSLTTGGYKVASEWTDSSGNNIAPNMFNVFSSTSGCYTVPGLAANGMLKVNNQAVVDSFDSRLGPYGGSNVGSNALLSTNSTGENMMRNENTSKIFGSVLVGPGGNVATVYSTHPNCTLTGTKSTLPFTVPMPNPSEPADMPASVGDVDYTAALTVLDADLRANKITIGANATLELVGDITILCDSDLVVLGKIMVSGSARIYLKGNMSVGTADINMNTGDPMKCLITKLGSGTVDFAGNSARVAARIVAPNATMSLRQSSEAFGTFIGQSVEIENKARFHVDTAASGPLDFQPDIAGSSGAAGNGGISSADTFATWFVDVPGQNLSGVHTIIAPLAADGFYTYSTTSFHPIDGRLYGNQTQPHNYFLAYGIDAQFTYLNCGGQMLEFRGGDGAWVFIDRSLVIDLGGTGSATLQRIDLDRLGLTPGNTYSLQLFYAQRQSSSNEFHLRTNILLTTPNVPTISALYD